MIICVTGTTCSGKHVFGEYFAKACKGELIDTDKIAHTLYAPDTPIWERVIKEFGKEVLGENNTIDRIKLREIVFSDEKNLKTLNRIVHPALHKAIDDIIPTCKGPAIIIAALIKELDLRVDYVIRVTSNDKKKAEYAKQKRISNDLLKQILQFQEETDLYDFDVPNNNSLEKLKIKAKDVWKDIREEQKMFKK